MYALGKFKCSCRHITSSGWLKRGGYLYHEFKNAYKSWSIVFFGSDNFSLVSFRALLKERNAVGTKKALIGSIEVVTTHRLNPIFKFCIDNNIKVHLWPPELNGSYDFGVVASFGKLIPKNLIDLFKLGIINVHASLLPKWRGAMPIVYAIKNGDTTTGITIQKIKPHVFDTGDIVMKRPCSIGKHELMPSLYNRLSECGSECLLDVVRRMPDCLDDCLPQEDGESTHARKLTEDVARVNWHQVTAEEVYNLYRSLYGLYDLKTTWQGVRVKLMCLSLNESDTNLRKGSGKEVEDSDRPGYVRYHPQHRVLLVNCKDQPIRVCTLVLNGRLYSATSFNRGFLTQLPKGPPVFGC